MIPRSESSLLMGDKSARMLVVRIFSETSAPMFHLSAVLVAILCIALTLLRPPRTGGDLRPETGAVRTIQMIHTAQVQYNSQFGRYAVSLAELGPPASGVASSSAADLVGRDLASGTVLGYKFVVRGNESGYVINAIPEIYGTTGRRTFYSDQTMVIRENNGPQPATASSNEMGSRLDESPFPPGFENCMFFPNR